VSRRTWLVVGAVLAVLTVAVVVVALASTSSSTSSSNASSGASSSAGSSAAGGAAVLPAASATVPTGSQVVVAMGHLDDPANTFYELFDRSAGSPSWVLATPPGVADNGGLVVGAATTGSLTAGFLPSADLTFSVLAQRAAGTSAWTPGNLPGTLARRPDGLATGADGEVAAVLARPTPSVVDAGPGLTSWERRTTVAGLAAVSPRCPVDGITAVALTSSGSTVVGTACARSSAAGLFTAAPSGGWTLLGPLVLPGAPTATQVLRLQAGAGGLVALLEGSGGGGATLAVAWGGSGADLSASAPLTVPVGWSVRGTAIGGGSGQKVTVLLGSDSGSGLRLESVDGPASGTAPSPWVALPAPPDGTAAVAAVGTDTDAFVPSGSQLTVWSTSPGAPSWTRVSRQSVPIQYGSSD
jgi:hypothetical protein